MKLLSPSPYIFLTLNILPTGTVTAGNQETIQVHFLWTVKKSSAILKDAGRKLSHLWAAPRRTGILSSEIMSSLARPRPTSLARPRPTPTTSAPTSSWGWNPRRPINDIPDSIMGPSCELDSWLNHCQTWLKYTLHSTQGKKAEPSPRVVLCWGWL